jgi:ABC-2 type transport system permease protein
MFVRPTLAVLEREVVKLLRQRMRLLATLVRPLLWLLVIGVGFDAVQRGQVGQIGNSGPSYQTFLVPGILGMTLLFGAMIAALSTVNDRESGVMRMLVIAPLEHYWIVIAKALGATLVALIQAAMLLVVLGLLGYLSSSVSVPLFLAGLFGTALACASLGMLIAAWVRSLENYAGIMNVVIFPVFFLSGSLYPIQKLPPLLQTVALINPFTHGVDLIKHSAIAGRNLTFPPDLSIGVDLLVIFGFSALALAIAAARFSAEGSGEPLVQRLAGGR